MKDRLGDMLLSTITRETIEGFQAKRKLDGVSNRTVYTDVGTLRKVLKPYGHWRRLQDHVTMLSEAGGAPIGRALTPEEQKRLFETAASHPEWEHVYCAAVLASNTSMRGVEVKHVRRKDVDLDKVTCRFASPSLIQSTPQCPWPPVSASARMKSPPRSAKAAWERSIAPATLSSAATSP